MKKYSLFVLTIVGTAMLMVSCKTKPEPDPKPQPVPRTVNPTAQFEMYLEGTNPEGYPTPDGGAVFLADQYVVTFRQIEVGGVSQSIVMRALHVNSNHIKGEYLASDYVRDSTCVGARMMCMLQNGTELTESPTEEQKAAMKQTMTNNTMGYEQKGPFKFRKICRWTFVNGRGQTSEVDDVIEQEFATLADLIDELCKHDASDPIFQSVYFYDSFKDEFQLQTDRKKWDFK